MRKTFKIVLEIETDSSNDNVKTAIERGLYIGLDMKGVASPDKINCIKLEPFEG